MIFDITYFGYGVGLVMLGWIVGICVRVVMNIAGMVGNL